MHIATSSLFLYDSKGQDKIELGEVRWWICIGFSTQKPSFRLFNLVPYNMPRFLIPSFLLPTYICTP